VKEAARRFQSTARRRCVGYVAAIAGLNCSEDNA
jgi:hypothetical protein